MTFREYVEQLDSAGVAQEILDRYYDAGREVYIAPRGEDGIPFSSFVSEPTVHVDAVRRQLLTASQQGNISRFLFTPFRMKVLKQEGDVESNKLRVVGKPSVRNIIAQHVMRSYLEERIDPWLKDTVYGYRQRRSAPDAARRLHRELKAGYAVALDLDLVEFFDRVNHAVLLDQVKQRFANDPLLTLLVKRYLKTPYIDRRRTGKMRGKCGSYYRGRQCGVPQGGSLSGLLSNLYLDSLDRVFDDEPDRAWMIRYADDVVVLVRRAEDKEWALARIQQRLAVLKLAMHPLGEKSRCIDLTHPTQGYVNYLGFKVSASRIVIARDNLMRFKRQIREILSHAVSRESVRTKQKERKSRIQPVVSAVNRFLQGNAAHEYESHRDRAYGWAHYFGNVSHGGQFAELDAWISRELLQQLRVAGDGQLFPKNRSALYNKYGLVSLASLYGRKNGSVKDRG